MTDDVVIHHKAVERRLKREFPYYTVSDIEDLLVFLRRPKTLDFSPLPGTALYPAASVDREAAEKSGYGYVWVRDNVYVALALEAAGRIQEACATVSALACFHRRHLRRFVDIVNGRKNWQDPKNRPRVRFDGANLHEIRSHWAHAQNDALGYFLWIYCRLARMGYITPDETLLALLALYFETIRYWEDDDSGHWEERRKVEASSIGAVVAGLKALRGLFTRAASFSCAFDRHIVSTGTLDDMISLGETALSLILPAECTQPGPRYRPYDSALLFLIYPLNVARRPVRQKILENVRRRLQGNYGIRRYLGDSYWTADYKDRWPADRLTADVSEHQEERDVLSRPGEEAQWCLFDPIVSVIFGNRYVRTGDAADVENQVYYLNRALGQLTGPDCPYGELRCPEAYYLEHGRYVPNDQVPLLWTQANLYLALLAMKSSAETMRS